MKNSLKLAMYEVTFKSGKKLSILCTRSEVIAHALGRNQAETMQDIVDLTVSWYL